MTDRMSGSHSRASLTIKTSNLFFCFSCCCSGCVTGLLKIGTKNLYVFDENGETQLVAAPCVLDFYIHESRQRAGLGKALFEHMLERENLVPQKMAIDRPSEKLVAFYRKHYGKCSVGYCYWVT